LKKERFQKGAINFETNEVKFKLDAQGKPLGVELKIRKDSHKLIEEFMLLANKKVAEFVFNLGKKKTKDGEEQESGNTMVYRTHEPPNPEKLLNFANFAARLGFTIRTDSEKGLSSTMNKMMEEVEGTGVQNVLEQLAVRTMSKARYTTEPLGHFGLAFEHYSHFTSPIRRYPDMMAHRLLQNYLDKKKAPSLDEYEKKAKHSSDREKLAAEAERASIKYKQVEFMSMQDHNTIFDGVVTGVTDFGIFVEITSTSCEGMVRLADLNDDFYELDKENYRIVGKRTGRIITFGEAVKVRVKATDMERRSMDLELVSVGGKAYKSSSGMANKAKGRDGRGGSSRSNSRRGDSGRGDSKRSTGKSSDKSSSNKDKGKRRRR
ncbi:MAG TPA: RNB domain-containing ribonuclease, partial [Emticicia sp.]